MSDRPTSNDERQVLALEDIAESLKAIAAGATSHDVDRETMSEILQLVDRGSADPIIDRRCRALVAKLRDLL